MRSCSYPQPSTPSPCCGRVVHRPLQPRVTSTVCQRAAVHSDILISTYTNDADELMRAATYSRLASDSDPSNQPVDLGTSTSSGQAAGQAEVIQFPQRSESAAGPRKEPPLVRVRLSVNYRVHSRQILCIGGSQIPFGWSFLSIAKVPMVWNQGDIWTAEVQSCTLLAFRVRNMATDNIKPYAGGTASQHQDRVQVCNPRGAGMSSQACPLCLAA